MAQVSDMVEGKHTRQYTNTETGNECDGVILQREKRPDGVLLKSIVYY